jgi:twitching motility protein PilI
MSKKEALSEFQSRLTGRLQSVDDSGAHEAAHWLAVEISGRGFMFPLSHSGEIFPWFEPQPIPYAKDWFLGVANLRGALCGVVSLEKYFHLKPLDVAVDSAIKTTTQDRRLIGFHTSFDLNTVLVVDRLVGLKNRHQMTDTSTASQYRDQQDVVWQEVDLRALAQDPAFISIAQ